MRLKLNNQGEKPDDYNRLNVLLGAGLVRRYHTIPMIGDQNNAAHSFGVAQIIRVIHPTASRELLWAALDHDMAEILTGDIPATAKWASKDLKKAVTKLEAEFESEYLEEYEITQAEAHILKIADMLELCFFCYYQKSLGNQYASEIFANGVTFLQQKLSMPEKAKEVLDTLVKDFFG